MLRLLSACRQARFWGDHLQRCSSAAAKALVCVTMRNRFVALHCRSLYNGKLSYSPQ
jgi:hypothetical protein